MSLPQESPSFDDGPVIENRQLVEISQDLFHDPVYGQAAVSILAMERREAQFTVYNFADGWSQHALQYDVGGLPGVLMDVKRLGSAPHDDNKLETRMNSLLERATTPFDFRLDRANRQDGERQVYLDGTPLDVRQNRLAAYLVGRGLEHHTLHGTLGKAADVLNVAAGSAEPKVAPERDLSDYLNWDQVLDSVEDAVPGHKTAYMRSKVDSMIWRQLHFGEPDRIGELIIEGMYNHDKGRWNKQRRAEQYVAKASLLSLANSYSSESLALPPVLRKIAGPQL